VVAKDGKSITEKDITDYVANKIAEFKVPKRVSFHLETRF
jgi:hypothetical protein